MKNIFLKSLLVFTFVTLLTIFFFARDTFAITVPVFPACLNPQGSVIASYSSGIHAVAGDPRTFEGSDTVYKVNDTQVLQCLCVGGEGIQSDWLKVTNQSTDEINAFITAGWVFIADGASWGLDPASYLVRNTAFSCAFKGGMGGGESSSSSSTNNITSGQVLGLASTGNIVTVYSWMSIGILLISLGLFLKKLNSKSAK